MRFRTWCLSFSLLSLAATASADVKAISVAAGGVL
jgi:hypothetical protein